MSSQWHMQTTSCGCFHNFCSWLEWSMVYSFLFNSFRWCGPEKRQNMLKKAVFMLWWFFGEQIFPRFLLVLLINGKNVSRYMVSCFSLVLTLKGQSRWKLTLLAWITLLSKMYGHFLSVSLSAKFFPNKVAFSLQLFDNECVHYPWLVWLVLIFKGQPQHYYYESRRLHGPGKLVIVLVCSCYIYILLLVLKYKKVIVPYGAM